MSNAIVFPPRMPIGTAQLPGGGTVTVSMTPEFFRGMQALLQQVTGAATIPLYFGTDFPDNAASPSMLVKMTGDGLFSDLVIRH